MTDSELARKIIEDNIYMVLATASLKGEPWISPVFFAFDDSYNLYWVSNKDALHSKLVRANPRVAITIFDSRAPEGDADAVYIKADVSELVNGSEMETGMTCFNDRVLKDQFKIKNAREVSDSGIWRIYKAIPSEVTKLGTGIFVNGQYVDQRVPVELSET